MQHRFFILIVDATAATVAATSLEAEGHEVLSMSPSMMPVQSTSRFALKQEPPQFIQVYHIATRIAADAPLTKTEEAGQAMLRASANAASNGAAQPGNTVAFPGAKEE